MSVSIDVQLSISSILVRRDSLSSLYRADGLEGVTDRDILGRIGNVGLDAPAPTSKDGGLIDGACGLIGGGRVWLVSVGVGLVVVVVVVFMVVGGVYGRMGFMILPDAL